MAGHVLPSKRDISVQQHASMARDNQAADSPASFIVEVSSELCPETLAGRSQAINSILRLAMLSGLPMELAGSLNLLCDLAAEIIPHDRTLLYFWDESQDRMQLRCGRGFAETAQNALQPANLFNLWVARYGRPLLIGAGHSSEADSVLALAGARSALVVPLTVNQRPVGSIQLFTEKTRLSAEDAQLLWILALVAENLLSREHVQEGLITLAFTDFLTNLKTRGYFEQQLDLEIKRSERKQTPLALLMIDIDHFKPLNDRYGHHVGDQVLRDLAAVLVKDMREMDTVARYGGEEFVIVLPETGASGALLVAQRLRRAVEQSRFFLGPERRPEHLTISIGIAVLHDDASFKRELIDAADAALYQAKSRGRNQVALASALPRLRPQAS